MNPYTAPSADLQNDGEYISQQVVDEMNGTRPWALFIAVLGFIFTGLIVVGILFGLLGLAMMGASGGSGATGASMGILGVAMLVYLVIAVIFFIPSLYLAKYANRIKEFALSPTDGNLEYALRAHKTVWVVMAVLMILGTLVSVASLALNFAGLSTF